MNPQFNNILIGSDPKEKEGYFRWEKNAMSLEVCQRDIAKKTEKAADRSRPA